MATHGAKIWVKFGPKEREGEILSSNLLIMRRGLQPIALPIGIKIRSISYKIKKVDYNAFIYKLYCNINFSILFLLPLFFFLFILLFLFLCMCVDKWQRQIHFFL